MLIFFTRIFLQIVFLRGTDWDRWFQWLCPSLSQLKTRV
jgi:hypothetical protein